MDGSTSTQDREGCASASDERNPRLLTTLIGAVLTVILSAGTAFAFQGPPSLRSLQQTVPISSGSEILIVNRQGDVVVTAAPGREMHIEARVSIRGVEESSRQALADAVRLRVTGLTSAVQVTTVLPDLPESSLGAGSAPRITVLCIVRVPADSPLEVRTRRGGIQVSGMAAAVRLEADDGRLVVRDSAGPVEAGSVDGDIELVGVVQDAAANTVSGNILLEDVGGQVRITCISGNIVMRRVAATSLSASSAGGDIRFEGSVRAGAAYVLSSHSGDIHFEAAGPDGLDLELSTFSGSIALPLSARLEGDRVSRRSLRASWGDPVARAELSTFSGNISVTEPPG